MSNNVNSTVMDNMRDNVHELWVIEGRPDLEDDCPQHCSQALSSADYKQMANESLNAQRKHYTKED